MNKFNVTLHTNGACRGNPGNGGYAALLQYKDKSKIISGGVTNTTNNRMELTAVVEGLKALNAPCQVVIHSDSRLVVQGISVWMHGWAQQGWRKSDGDAPAHMDLWKQLYEFSMTHSVSAVWMKRHSGDSSNTNVNQIAKASVPV
jgi:ribonuclease HI